MMFDSSAECEARIQDVSYAELLNLCFDVPEGEDFLTDFPVWSSRFLKPHSCKRLSILLGDQWIASASIRLANLRVEYEALGDGLTGSSHSSDAHLSSNRSFNHSFSRRSSKIKIALLGAVACHPKYRGQGLASDLIQRACDWAQSQGAQGVFLWGSEPALYVRLGFRYFGQQVRSPLRVLDLGVHRDGQFEVRSGFNSDLFHCLQKRRGGLELGAEDELLYQAHRSVEWRYVLDQGKVLAYAGLGRGLDLKEHVHEWGGDVSALRLIFKTILKDYPQAILLSSSAHLDGYFPGWRSLCVGASASSVLSSPVVEPLCLALFFDQNSFRFYSDQSQVRLFWFWGLDAS